MIPHFAKDFLSLGLLWLTCLHNLKADCANTDLVSEIGLDIGTEPVTVQSTQCAGAWPGGLTCLRNVENFNSAVTTYLISLNSIRSKMKEKIYNNYEELVTTRITAANKASVLSANEVLLFPHNVENEKYKFKITFDHCMDDLNQFIVQTLCHLTGPDASSMVDNETQTININESNVYGIIKNCLEVCRTFCLYTKYLNYSLSQLQGLIYDPASDENNDICNNSLAECASNYSNEACTLEFKNRIVTKFITLRGIKDLEVFLGVINYIFEGTEPTTSLASLSDLSISVSENGFNVETAVSDIEYSVGSHVMLWPLMIISILSNLI